MELLAPAKINIFLEVTGRRPDGYHNIESIFQTVSLFDRLTIAPHPRELSLSCTLPSLPTDERNIVFRAAALLRESFGVSAGARLRLEKHIPMGAGLGGGSSDAAAALKGLIKLWKLSVPAPRLVRLAAQLGADVPFFLAGGTALVRGIGERVLPLKGVKTAHYVLIYPRLNVPTAGVYKQLCMPLTKKQKITTIRSLLVSGSSSRRWSRWLYNRLEEAVFPGYPQVRRVREALNGLGYPCLMSGSGSTVFAVVSSPTEGKKLQAELKRYPWDIRVVKTISS